MSQLILNVPDDSLLSLKLSDEAAGAEIRLAASVKLYELGRLSSRAAARLAGIPGPAVPRASLPTTASIPSASPKTSLSARHPLPDVICNTSPLQYLHQIGCLELLPQLVSRVTVPTAVAQELAEGRRRGLDLPHTRGAALGRFARPSERAGRAPGRGSRSGRDGCPALGPGAYRSGRDPGRCAGKAPCQRFSASR